MGRKRRENGKENRQNEVPTRANERIREYEGKFSVLYVTISGTEEDKGVACRW